ncbi:MAG TPA: hypothetical protein VMO00_16130, partial [Methylomirabilota bacterium]|nr:hypothetical protein [Methylomirabilota bacterium]
PAPQQSREHRESYAKCFHGEIFYQQGNKSSFNCVKFSIERKSEAQKSENDDNSVNEVIPSDDAANTLACASE